MMLLSTLYDQSITMLIKTLTQVLAHTHRKNRILKSTTLLDGVRILLRRITSRDLVLMKIMVKKQKLISFHLRKTISRSFYQNKKHQDQMCISHIGIRTRHAPGACDRDIASKLTTRFPALTHMTRQNILELTPEDCQ